MKNRNTIFIFFLWGIMFISCQNHEKDRISIEILSDKIISNSLRFEVLGKREFWETKNVHNIIRFKFCNNTENTQILNTLCLKGGSYLGCSSMNSFPKHFTGLGLNNLLIIDYESQKPRRDGSRPSMSDDFLRFIALKDSIMHDHYNKLGYERNDGYYTDYNFFHDQNTIVLKPYETKYFETYFDLPINRSSAENSSEFIELKKSKQYRASLIFHCDSTGLKSQLNKLQLKNFEHSNSVFFHGTLISKNSIPLIIN